MTNVIPTEIQRRNETSAHIFECECVQWAFAMRKQQTLSNSLNFVIRFYFSFFIFLFQNYSTDLWISLIFIALYLTNIHRTKVTWQLWQNQLSEFQILWIFEEK